MNVNLELSREYAEIINAKSKQCFWNAWMCALKNEAFLYVEGNVVNGFPFEHGWVEWGDEIIDPTLVLIENSLDGYTYFAGEKYDPREFSTLPTLPLFSGGNGFIIGDCTPEAFVESRKNALEWMGGEHESTK